MLALTRLGDGPAESVAVGLGATAAGVAAGGRDVAVGATAVGGPGVALGAMMVGAAVALAGTGSVAAGVGVTPPAARVATANDDLALLARVVAAAAGVVALVAAKVQADNRLVPVTVRPLRAPSCSTARLLT